MLYGQDIEWQLLEGYERRSVMPGRPSTADDTPLGCLGDTSSSIVACRHRNVLFAQSDKMTSACDVNVLHFGAKRVYNQSPCVPCPASRYTTQRETSGATASRSCRWSDAGCVT